MPDLPTCGLLRIEARLWLLASEIDLVNGECDDEEEWPRSKLDRLLFPMDLPVKEGCESMRSHEIKIMKRKWI